MKRRRKCIFDPKYLFVFTFSSKALFHSEFDSDCVFYGLGYGKHENHLKKKKRIFWPYI